MTPAIHRLIEQHAAKGGDAVAVLDGTRRGSYRELNYAANAAARRLMTAGFRRGGHAYVRMPPSMELAVILLAVLKAGGSYTVKTIDGEVDTMPEGVSIRVRPDERDEQRCLHLDAASLADLRVPSSPNLPVIARGADIACVLEGVGAGPGLMVPHATIVAMRFHPVTSQTRWTGEPDAFDLWIALMTGSTAVVSERAATVAA